MTSLRFAKVAPLHHCASYSLIINILRANPVFVEDSISAVKQEETFNLHVGSCKKTSRTSATFNCRAKWAHCLKIKTIYSNKFQNQIAPNQQKTPHHQKNPRTSKKQEEQKRRAPLLFL
ncbi:MAG: hypothetical protein GC205_13120 [Bacteroidetes bacterium]|nr:hypothetical protein [Bacteroidota bacterium]